MTKEFSWMKERGVAPSQWLENHPNECDLLFSIRQAFRPDYKKATVYRANVVIYWLSNARFRLCRLGNVQEDVRAEALRRFKAVEAMMKERT